MDAKSSRGLRVLWATDGSDNALAAVPLLRRVILPAAERVVALTVAPQSILSAARPDPTLLTGAGGRARDLAAARAIAERDAASLGEGTFAVEAASRWGHPIEEILRASAAMKADLIVLSARGHSNLALIFLGSVSQGVVQHSTRPVLIARGEAKATSTVVLGYDGSAASRKAARFLSRLYLPASAKIVLACVVEPFVVPSATPAAYRRRAMKEAHAINVRRHHEAERTLRSLADGLTADGRDVTTKVLAGSAGPEIDACAREHGADLIVVGSRKPSAARHFLLGSTAEKLVRHAHTSVLVVR